MKIENFCAQAVIDGKPCFILIPKGCSGYIIDLTAALSEGGELKAIKASDTFKMMTLEDIKND